VLSTSTAGAAYRAEAGKILGRGVEEASARSVAPPQVSVFVIFY
jgi:hypothetical protein